MTLTRAPATPVTPDEAFRAGLVPAYGPAGRPSMKSRSGCNRLLTVWMLPADR